MAMYANVQWSRIVNNIAQPLWAVFSTIWDENGNIVYDRKGNPIIVSIKVSPPGFQPALTTPPTPNTTNIPIIPVVFP